VRRRTGSATAVVAYEPTSDTSAAEALIAAALVGIESVRRTAAERPIDAGLVRYAGDNLRVAVEALEIRRRMRTGA
jgi:hypothetical protein